MTTVVEQHQAGIGGDGFILAYVAKEDRVIFINGTGPAPKLATAEFYRKLGKIPDAGPYSTDVPGMAGGFDLALKKYGTMSYEGTAGARDRSGRQGAPLIVLGVELPSQDDSKALTVPEFRQDAAQERWAFRTR